MQGMQGTQDQYLASQQSRPKMRTFAPPTREQAQYCPLCGHRSGQEQEPMTPPSPRDHRSGNLSALDLADDLVPLELACTVWFPPVRSIHAASAAVLALSVAVESWWPRGQGRDELEHVLKCTVAAPFVSEWKTALEHAKIPVKVTQFGTRTGKGG